MKNRRDRRNGNGKGKGSGRRTHIPLTLAERVAGRRRDFSSLNFDNCLPVRNLLRNELNLKSVRSNVSSVSVGNSGGGGGGGCAAREELDIFPLLDKEVEEIICLGLGSPSSSMDSLTQLAFLLEVLARLISPVTAATGAASPVVRLWDPLSLEVEEDLAFFKEIGWKFEEIHWNSLSLSGRPSPSSPSSSTVNSNSNHGTFSSTNAIPLTSLNPSTTSIVSTPSVPSNTSSSSNSFGASIMSIPTSDDSDFQAPKHVDECNDTPTLAPVPFPPLKKSLLLYLPHIPHTLLNFLLSSNWNPFQLERLVFLGNEFSAYLDDGEGDEGVWKGIGKDGWLAWRKEVFKEGGGFLPLKSYDEEEKEGAGELEGLEKRMEEGLSLDSKEGELLQPPFLAPSSSLPELPVTSKVEKGEEGGKSQLLLQHSHRRQDKKKGKRRGEQGGGGEGERISSGHFQLPLFERWKEFPYIRSLLLLHILSFQPPAIFEGESGSQVKIRGVRISTLPLPKALTTSSGGFGNAFMGIGWSWFEIMPDELYPRGTSFI